ncbi:hypothetical protein [Ruoffia tabacinasalis]|uniref:Yip1 domain-containing protein n=1 Tax=Ruoffia tabacinasalis TaxID=87458 RepID=A0ABS0LKN3_9LACT|nr:hypothetical protein [Ruoffia tabacinasalis]MBG9978694.1 hypothetical protein [Ruoffia tabacinasalis]
MFLGKINQSNALTLFSLFFGAVGVGFSMIGESQYTIISLIIASVGYIFSYRFTAMFEREDAQISFDLEFDVLSKSVVYALLPASLLISLSLGSVLSVIVAALYILAVIIRLAHFNQAIEFQGEQFDGKTQGLPLEASAIFIPIISLLGYVIPMNIFQYVLAVAYIIIGASFVVKYPIPKLPEKWLVYVLILALVLVVAFIFLGTLTPVLA